MSECTHDCSSCSSNCDSRKEPQSFIEKPNQMSNIGKVIGVVSGKGGVGKTLVSSLLAVSLQRLGKNVGIMDADITGPSVPKAFGIHSKAEGCEFGIIPVKSKMGIDVMSINLLLENESDPVVWRGPVIAGVVKQFWSDVIWDDVDFMFVDMPPGTGDVPLTVFQSIPLDGIVIVTSPQELVSLVVSKAVNMAKTMEIPIIGLVENMSYVLCPDCGKKIEIYGKSKTAETAKEQGLELLAQVPFDSNIASLTDKGEIERITCNYLDTVVEKLENMLK